MGGWQNEQRGKEILHLDLEQMSNGLGVEH